MNLPEEMLGTVEDVWLVATAAGWMAVELLEG
jgi:hypothetical protein